MTGHGPSPGVRRARWPQIAALAALCFVAFFLGLGRCGIFDLDEGLYVACAREMRLTGDWVTPRINGKPFYEKPPLVYWVGALSLSAFGQNEFAARLPSAVSCALLVALVCTIGARVLGWRTGLLAGALFALSPLGFASARELTTDATLDLWVAAALFSFYLGYSAPPGRGKRWYYAFWAACGPGVLAKGAPGLGLPVAVALVFVVWAERFRAAGLWRVVREAHVLPGLLLIAAVAVPWHYAAWRANGPAFWDEYIVRQHVRRFLGGDTSHRAPVWFYIPGFLLGFFPWSFFTVPALLERPREDAADTSGLARLFLKVWILVVFVAFSASGSKLVSYILPMYAAAALLTADWLQRASAQAGRRRAMVLGSAGALALSAALGGVLWLHRPILREVEARTHRAIPLDAALGPLVALASVMMLLTAAACAAALALALGGRPRAVVGALLAGMGAFIAVAVVAVVPALDAAVLAPLHRLARLAGAVVGPGEDLVVAVAPPGRPSVLFYLPDRLLLPAGGGRRVVEVVDPASAVAFPGPSAVVLTDGPRAAPLLARPGAALVASSGPWRLLHLGRAR